MKFAFFCNYLNNHQVHVADELYRLLGEEYVYVATSHEKAELKGGADYGSRPYLFVAAETLENWKKALELARTAEVCIFGAESLDFAIERAKHKDCGIAFELGERWMKRGWLNILSPRLQRWWWNYQTLFRFRPYYKLNASAFAADDHARLLSYEGRCYKWGYFTRVEKFDVEASPDVSTSNITPLMWCSRYLMWKHPELPVLMAERLKRKGYRFRLDMYGSGEYEGRTRQLAQGLDVTDVVRFMGSKPNDELLAEMRRHSIFLFTSDRNEGWGAVANESMSNGCVLVASDAIGSVPYLLEDGMNGFAFGAPRTTSSFDRYDRTALDSLCEKVEWLLDHPEKRETMRQEAVRRMQTLWSPQVAAERLLTLIDCLQNKRWSPFSDGPCSKA